MAKKCYIVSVEIETPVWAESAEEAKKYALRDALNEEINNLTEHDLSAAPASYMPAGWDNDCLVWGKDTNDMTLGEALKNTPEYAETLNRLSSKLRQIKE